jgi:preprotein translocase subunit SecF
MQFFKKTNFDFIGNMNKAFIFSGSLILLTFAAIIWHKGLNASIDFTGGTVVQMTFEKPVQADLGRIRSIVAGLNFGSPEIKTIGAREDNEIQIIVKQQGEGTFVGDAIKKALDKDYPENPFQLRREEKVGPKIGSELQRNATIAVLLSLIVILVYVGIRFHLPFGIAAIVALFHDVIITIGVFAVFDYEFSLPIIGALLTIVGYSLNVTIVVFDRIRENIGGLSAKKNFDERVNTSINETLSRTIITSVTTLAVVVVTYAYFFTAGDVLTYFSLALIVGVGIGTYSSIFIASPILILWNRKWHIK